jgi:hypothetical protein
MKLYHLKTIIALSAILLGISVALPSFAEYERSDGGMPGGYRSDTDHTNSNSSEHGGSDHNNPGSSGYPSAPVGYHWEHIGGQNNDRDVLVADAPSPPPPAPPPKPDYVVYNNDPWNNTPTHDRIIRTTVSGHATVDEGTLLQNYNSPSGLYCGQDLTDAHELLAGRPPIHEIPDTPHGYGCS